MSGLLKGDLDVAQAMIYNEYAQVLEAKNPATGQLYKPDDLNVIDFNDPSVGTAMLQDQIFATRQVAQDRQQRRHRHEVPEGDASRAGSTAATTPRSASTSCSPRARSSAPATRPGR